MIIVRFSLEWSALSDHGQRPAQQVVACRRIVEFWAEHGVLVILGGEEGRGQFFTSIDAMPQCARKLWKEAIKRLRTRCVYSEQPIVENFLDPSHLSCLAGHVELVGAEDERCELLGVADTDPSAVVPGNGIEVARLHSIDQAQKVLHAKKIASADLRKGNKAVEIWARRVRPMLPWTTDLVIVDRYCGVDVHRCSTAAQSGLEFVLRQSWNEEIGVTVYAAEPRKQPNISHSTTIAEFQNAVAAVVNHLVLEKGPRTRSLAIKMLPDWNFGRLSHDRYLRFNAWLLRLDVGLEPFSASGLQRKRSACEMVYCSADGLKDKQRIERQLFSAVTKTFELPPNSDRLTGPDA